MGEKIYPHSMISNYSQINIGIPGRTEDVDVWHTDSVECVLIISLCDQTNFEGGDL